jgi:predicted DNA binding CopG/RHH family protein
MRLKEFAAPKTASKPAPKDANAIEAETIKRQQQKLADREAQLNVQKTEKQLAQQRQKARNLKTSANSPH